MLPCIILLTHLGDSGATAGVTPSRHHPQLSQQQGGGAGTWHHGQKGGECLAAAAGAGNCVHGGWVLNVAGVVQSLLLRHKGQ
jgi:hypothetical protein